MKKLPVGKNAKMLAKTVIDMFCLTKITYILLLLTMGLILPNMK